MRMLDDQLGETFRFNCIGPHLDVRVSDNEQQTGRQWDVMSPAQAGNPCDGGGGIRLIFHFLCPGSPYCLLFRFIIREVREKRCLDLPGLCLVPLLVVAHGDGRLFENGWQFALEGDVRQPIVRQTRVAVLRD